MSNLLRQASCLPRTLLMGHGREAFLQLRQASERTNPKRVQPYEPSGPDTSLWVVLGAVACIPIVLITMDTLYNLSLKPADNEPGTHSYKVEEN